MKAIMSFLQWARQAVLTAIFATIIWGAEIAWLVFLGIVVVKLIK